MIEYAPYQLEQKAALNRLDLSSVREGMLLRLDRSQYACLHPWPELGDPTLAECIDDLKSGRPNPLLQRALDLASSFAQESLPGPPVKSHATLPKLNGSPMLAAVEADFTAVKIKRGKDWMRLRKKTEAFIKGYPCVRWRIDFNGALKSHRELSQFLGAMPREQIDFIEDPFSDPVLAENWKGFPIAYDRVIPNKLDLEHNYLVAKPAIQSRETLSQLAGDHPHKVIFTSYMDHPIGQIAAYKEAQQFYLQHSVYTPPLGGLATQDLYQSTAYSDLLGSANPQLSLPSSQDLITLLEQENWLTP